MFAGSGQFPPVDGSMSRLAPATIFVRREVDLGRADVAGEIGSGGLSCISNSVEFIDVQMR